MKTRQLATMGLGLIAFFAFATAGCSGTAGSPTVTDTSSASPGGTPSAGSGDAAAALTAAAAELTKNSFKMTTNVGQMSTVVATMDPPKKAGQTTFTTMVDKTTVTIDSRMLDTDVYLKLQGLIPTLEGKWLHVDVQRLSPDSQLGFRPGEFDPASSERLLRTATDVRRTGDHAFAGTVDLTKVAGMALVNDKTTVNLGDQARTVPFEATTDDQNRLATIKITVPAVAGQPAQTIDTKYSDFGAPVTIERPAAGEVTEAPDVFYQTVGGR